MAINLEAFLFNTVNFQFFVSITIFLLSPFNVLLFRLSIYYYLSSTFLQQDFEKMKVYPFHRRKVDSRFVIVGGNCICHRCVIGD